MLAWPTSRQSPTAGEEIRFAIVRRRSGVKERASGAGIDGREVLEGDDHAEALGAAGERGERAGLRQPGVLAGGLVGKVGGVVDDVRGAHLGGVGDQALEGEVAVARAGRTEPGP